MSPVPCCGAAGDRGLRFPEISGGGTASQVVFVPRELILCVVFLLFVPSELSCSPSVSVLSYVIVSISF